MCDYDRPSRPAWHAGLKQRAFTIDDLRNRVIRLAGGLLSLNWTTIVSCRLTVVSAKSVDI